MNAGVRIRFEDLRNRWLQILSSEKDNAKQNDSEDEPQEARCRQRPSRLENRALARY